MKCERCLVFFMCVDAFSCFLLTWYGPAWQTGKLENDVFVHAACLCCNGFNGVCNYAVGPLCGSA